MKKSISPVVALALLLVTAVVAVVGFQAWFNSYSSGVFSQTETQSSNSVSQTGIDTLVGSELYFNNAANENITITRVSIEGTDCNVSGSYSSGVFELNVTPCVSSITDSEVDVVVYTNEGIYSKKIYKKILGGSSGGVSFSDCTLNNLTVSHGDNASFYENSLPFSTLSSCDAISQMRYCSDGTLNGSSNYLYSSCNDSAAPSSGGDWVLVPGNSNLNTSDFYIMVYEAKNSGGDPTSQAASAPWGSITQTSASSECSSLGTGYHLITNNEWMTAARNLENQSSNWGNGIIGSTISSGGGLKRGNVGVVDSASYSGSVPADYGTSRNSKALMNLSTGEGIWDMNGNMMEWTSDTIDCSGGYNCVNMPYDSSPGSEYIELTSINTYGKFSYDELRPINNSWNSNYGMGQIFTDSNTATGGSTTHSVIRGLGSGYTSIGGIYSGILAYSPAHFTTAIGFRCAYTP